MPYRINLSPEDESFLRAEHHKHPHKELAARIGCCVDTLKRILVRLDLQQFDGAKYQLRRDATVQMWTRPCLDCGNTKRRPKAYYYCLPCRSRRGFQDQSPIVSRARSRS